MLLTFVASSNDFSVKNGRVIWQKVYEGKSPLEVLSDITIFDDIILGKVVNHLVDYNKHGYNIVNVPELARALINSNVFIEVKQGKYRVTLSKIVFKEQIDQGTRNDAHQIAEEKFLKKGELTDYPKMLESMEIISTELKNLFSSNNLEKDNW